MRERLLEIAEPMARRGGYNGFSFRDIAAAAGIKAASVHYHFPAKADLGAALVRRYSDRFFATLGAPDADLPAARVDAFVERFRKALTEDGQMCLCGVLGAESANLPPEVSREIAAFFTRAIDWLSAVHSGEGPPDATDRARATRFVAALEGALLLARASGDDGVFDTVAAGLA